MPINPQIAYQQVLSMALEDRASRWQDIVSSQIPLFDVLSRRGMWETYSGPRIRQTLEFNMPAIQWYRDYDFLQNDPQEFANDAFFIPKQAAVPVSLSMTEILNNRGRNQIKSVMREKIRNAEKGLAQGMDASQWGDGTAFGGKALDGMGAAVPEVPTNTYGGISRVTEPRWATGAYNMATAFPTLGTTVTSTNVKQIFDTIVGNHTRGQDHPDLILACAPHWNAYNAATMSIQRITRDDGGVGRLGFRTLEYVGPGGRAEIVWGGGIGTKVPTNTTLFLSTDHIRMRYNPDRNFDTLFSGDGAKPINQDAIAQFVGWMGNLCLTNGLFCARLFGG